VNSRGRSCVGGGGLCTIVRSWQWTAGPWRLQWVGGDRWARVLGEQSARGTRPSRLRGQGRAVGGLESASVGREAVGEVGGGPNVPLTGGLGGGGCGTWVGHAQGRVGCRGELGHGRES
jgi:hypothetical protein